MSKDYWDGALWVYQATITNGGGGGGTNSYLIVPGAGNEMELLYARLFNGDTANRSANAVIETNTAGEVLTRLIGINTTIAAGADRMWPYASTPADNAPMSGGSRVFIAGTMRLYFEVLSVGASDDTALGLVCRIRGGVPTVTETGASTPTIVTNVERVF